MKKGSGDEHLFLWGPHWETWKKVLGWVSLPMGPHWGMWGRG